VGHRRAAAAARALLASAPVGLTLAVLPIAWAAAAVVVVVVELLLEAPCVRVWHQQQQ
jgi:hypothetical protein